MQARYSRRILGIVLFSLCGTTLTVLGPGSKYSEIPVLVFKTVVLVLASTLLPIFSTSSILNFLVTFSVVGCMWLFTTIWVAQKYGYGLWDMHQALVIGLVAAAISASVAAVVTLSVRILSRISRGTQEASRASGAFPVSTDGGTDKHEKDLS